MTESEFLKKCQEILGYDPLVKGIRWKQQFKELDQFLIKIEWVIGGKTGGSCYGSEHMEPREPEPEPEFEDLDKILEVMHPELTFLQYKRLSREVIQSDTYNDGDYYGNDRIMARKQINLSKLYDYLVEKGWL